MANTTTMYHTEKNPLHKQVLSPKGARHRRLHKVILRYHVPENWPLIREVLKNLGLARTLVGKGAQIWYHQKVVMKR